MADHASLTAESEVKPTLEYANRETVEQTAGYEHALERLGLTDAPKPEQVSGSSNDAWQRAIEKVVRSVVSVRFTQPYSFDTDLSKTSQASGFVVDAERGYVLTNRHVVGAGPFTGYIVFSNQEEVEAFPVYRDPVHDFGFLRFDRSASE
jgi:S1-C subfamily serine protease